MKYLPHNMPPKIMARPMMGVMDRHCGPWALDDPYGNASEYYHSDAVNALVEAATRAQKTLTYLGRVGMLDPQECEETAELFAAITAIKGEKK